MVIFSIENIESISVISNHIHNSHNLDLIRMHPFTMRETIARACKRFIAIVTFVGLLQMKTVN